MKSEVLEKNTIVPLRHKTHLLGEYLDKYGGNPEIEVEGLPKVNDIIYGLQRKKLYTIGGRPSNGKTALVCQMMWEASKKHKVLYLSLEMTIEESLFRFFCYHTKTPNYKLRAMHDNYSDMLQEFENVVNERKIIISEEIGRSFPQVKKAMETELSKDMPDIVILDYIQCIKTKGKRLEEYEDYIREFRADAIKNNYCLILLSQINRSNVSGSESRMPSVEGLKNCGFLEEHSDVVLLTHYPYKYGSQNMNEFKTIIAKNKNGDTGITSMYFEPSIYRFSEQPTSQMEKKILDIKQRSAKEDAEWEE